MISYMFCGTRSFSHVDDDDTWAPSTPKGSRRKQSKNPYSRRGLDKFSTVLADLEARREKIMEKVGSQGVTMVLFVHSSQDWVPIIVRLPDQKPEITAKRGHVKNPVPPIQRNISEIVNEDSPPIGPTGANETVRVERVTSRKVVKKSFSWSVKEGDQVGSTSWRWKPCYYWPVVMVLILLCLVLFGRVFAICCTSIWWYLVPTIEGGSGGDVRRSMKKKEYGRRLSTDKRIGGEVATSSQPKRM